MMEQRVCKKCLLRELDEGYFSSIYAYIENIPSEQRVQEEEYHDRLAICKACDSLVNGMCALCGCFVEVRAAKRIQYCPAAPSKW